MNRENLQKLAAYLSTSATAMRFSMKDYCRDKNNVTITPKNHACGTVACALGHGPAAGISADDNWTWDDYSWQRFGLAAFTDEWEWLFDGDWVETDNTPIGAAQRIQWLLENGLPHNWRQQMRGKAPLCYRGEPSQ